MTDITTHTHLRQELEGKTIDRIETRRFDTSGFSAITLIMRDGTKVYLNTVAHNGGSYLTAEAS